MTEHIQRLASYHGFSIAVAVKRANRDRALTRLSFHLAPRHTFLHPKFYQFSEGRLCPHYVASRHRKAIKIHTCSGFSLLASPPEPMLNNRNVNFQKRALWRNHIGIKHRHECTFGFEKFSPCSFFAGDCLLCAVKWESDDTQIFWVHEWKYGRKVSLFILFCARNAFAVALTMLQKHLGAIPLGKRRFTCINIAWWHISLKVLCLHCFD